MAKGAGAAGQTTIDGLRSVYTDLAGLMLLPDSSAHQGFITSLMQGIQKYVTQQAMAATQRPMPGAGPGGPQGAPPPGGPTPPGMPSGSGGPTGPAHQGPPPGAGGPSPGVLNAPNPDELRRILAMSGGPGA